MRFPWLLVLALLVAGCGSPSSPSPKAQAQGARTRLVFFGDSLTAGRGVAPEATFPAQIEAALEKEGYALKVVNAGVSGDTTQGGLARVEWVLKSRPDWVFLGLGANDGLRGVPVETIRENLETLIDTLRDQGAKVALLGMQLPRNFPADYRQDFQAIFPELAREKSLPLFPFLLEDVAMRPLLNLPDGIHPNAEGYQKVAENLLPFLRECLGPP